MGPYLSWALLLAVVAVLGRYYTKDKYPASKHKGAGDRHAFDSSPKKAKRRQKRAAAGPPPATTNRLPTATSNEPTPAAAAAAAATSASEADVEEDSDDAGDDMSNNDFARQFSMTRKGTDLTTTKSKDSKRDLKFVKPKSIESKNMPADSLDTRSSEYVSDMLEPEPPKPSVFRITGPVQEEKPSKNDKRKPPRPVETKEQAHRRHKQEKNREMVQQAEEERRKLMEKQLHTARELERKEQARKAPAANAWGTSSPTNEQQRKEQTASGDFLDTFEPPQRPSNRSSENFSPAEQEQPNKSPQSEQSDQWTTVSGRKDRKKNTKVDSATSETSASDISAIPPSQPASEKSKAASQDSSDARLKRKERTQHSSGAFSYVPNEHGHHRLDSDWAA